MLVHTPVQSKEELALFAITRFLETQQIPDMEPEEVRDDLRQEAACFVTVYVDKSLHGCIGTCQPTEPLFRNIIRYAILAGFFDFRSLPLYPEELPHVRVEVSVLSPLQEVDSSDINQFLAYLLETRPGVILERGGRRALFLPQVWERFHSPKAFLANLCLKAGLPKESWKEVDTQFWIFTNRTDI